MRAHDFLLFSDFLRSHASRFKLRLRPKSMKLKMNGMRLAPLPHGKTAVDVFGDFLSYLFRCTRSFIIDTHANGHSLWRAVEHDIQFVLSHPNGWEGAQQSKMRRAAVYGGLIPDTDEGRARIRFVTEGEASLHACVLNGLAADVLSVSTVSRGWRSSVLTPPESVRSRIHRGGCGWWHTGYQLICHTRHITTRY